MPERPPAAATVARRIVRCPGCGGQSVYAVANEYRPFCSERCRSTDLGAWASGGYRVAAPPSAGDAEGDSVPPET